MNRLLGVPVLLLVLLPGAPVPAGDKTEKDYTATPLADLDVVPVAPQKEETGFVIGGKNRTELIRALKEINERAIADLEAEMRPGKLSQKGFLGQDEKLLDILAADNEYVLGTLGLTHQELARHMLVAAAIGKKHKDAKDGVTFRYHGRRYRVSLIFAKGYVDSPFRDDTRTNMVASVENLGNGKTLKYSVLVPQMIERYGFYEGKGTPYRVDPREIIAVFDFLGERKER